MITKIKISLYLIVNIKTKYRSLNFYLTKEIHQELIDVILNQVKELVVGRLMQGLRVLDRLMQSLYCLLMKSQQKLI